MKKITLFIILFVLSIGNSFAQDAKYKSTLKKMFELSGTEEAYKMAITQMIGMFKEQKTNVPSKFWDEFETEMMKTSLNELVEMITPVYFKHLNQADLDVLVEFYKTPTGKKFAEKTPLIMQESMAIGQEWGKQIGENVAKKLQEKGY